MAKLSEVLLQLNKHKFKKAILDHVVDYIDSTFLSGLPSENMALLTDDRIRVPDEEVEEFVNSLLKMQKENNNAIEGLLNHSVVAPAKDK